MYNQFLLVIYLCILQIQQFSMTLNVNEKKERETPFIKVWNAYQYKKDMLIPIEMLENVWWLVQ